MKKIIAIATTLIAFSSANVLAADANTGLSGIAVVNVQQIFQTSTKIADLNKKLQAQFKGRQDKLVQSQKDLQTEIDKFKKDGPTLDRKASDAMQKKITDDQSNLSKDATSFQQDLSKEQNRIMKDVISQLNGIISSQAKKNNYSLVLDSQAVIYVDGAADITKQVEQQFDGK